MQCSRRMSLCFGRFQVIVELSCDSIFVELFATVSVHYKFTIPLFRYWKQRYWHHIDRRKGVYVKLINKWYLLVILRIQLITRDVPVFLHHHLYALYHYICGCNVKSGFLKFKRWKRQFRLWMEWILIGHIYHMINNDSITDHTVKINSIISSQFSQSIVNDRSLRSNNILLA
jgi:hypothetical protein